MKLILNLLISTLLVTVCRSGKTDKSLVDKAKGKDVVEAVDYLIKGSAIFAEDHGILVRMAFVATQFGDDPDTFTTKFNMWGLVQAKFDITKDTKTYPILTTIYTKINQKFNIDWSKVQFTDMSKPLISALAVHMILAINQPVPLYLEEQGVYYNKVFSSTTSSDQFYEKVKNMEKLGKCFGRMNLAIVLDGSGSINATNFELARTFVSNLVDTFSLDNVNVGFIVFSQTSTVVFPLNNNLSKQDMKTKIATTGYPAQRTNTSGAIRTGIDMLLKATHREGSPSIMTIFTDGEPNVDEPDTIPAARDAAKNNITLFGIGIGNAINQANLLSMVDNKNDRILSMKSYKSLSESFEMMNKVTCEIPQKPIIGKKVNDTLIQKEKRYFCYDLPSIGITVTLEVKVGKTDAFYSYTQQNPSSALNDGVIDGQTYIPVMQSNRVCVTVEGLEIHNNFTINSDAGNKVVPTPNPNDDDGILNLRRKAQDIAKNAMSNLKDYNQITNEVCNQMSKSYSKYQWICVVGEKVEISEHQLPKSLFQFGFRMGTTDFYFIINVPDN